MPSTVPIFEQPVKGWNPWFLAGAAALLSYFLGFAVCRVLRCTNLVDRPNDRSSHDVPTLRGGGIGIMLAIWTGYLVVDHGFGPSLASTVLLGSFILAVLSFFDDRYSLAWSTRIAFQLLVTIGVVVAFCLTMPAMVAPTFWIFAPLLVLWIAGYANAFNFMDGINGLAGFQAVLSGMGAALIALRAGLAPSHPAVVLNVLLAGGAAGFLPHNFPSARMFMGDVGSVPLGFLLAVVAIWIAAAGGWPLLIPLGCLHANYILDTGITLVRRLRRGAVVYQAHREHFYQRAVRAGKSHTTVTLSEVILEAAVGTVAIWAAGRTDSWPALVGAPAFALGCWGAFFLWCERVFRCGPAVD
jgi:UDP-N-acetylmuramyl pentapeptide phosphotransferase/UDP-N-acetylglucosamine-1-phosphate transferase